MELLHILETVLY